MANKLFFLSLADIFSVYPQIFKEITVNEQKQAVIYLPSDIEWQEKMYYMLLDVQKNINEALSCGKNYDDIMKLKEKPIFDESHIIHFSPATSPNGSGSPSDSKKRCQLKRDKTNLHIVWTLEHICKAARLLKRPKEENVSFTDEYEMRNVYSLIYDVFRYKLVLKNALQDIGFYTHHPEYISSEYRVWLMLYELYERSFEKRNAVEAENQLKLYEATKISDVAKCLWKFRAKLAASITRMRIKYRALSLSQLLPLHLQNDKVAIAALNPIVTGWMNPFLVKDKKTAEMMLSDHGFKVVDSETVLQHNNFAWDNVCPLFLSCLPLERSEFTKSELVLGNYFILQDRTFAVGPSVMCRLLDFFDLFGDIIQTHIDSPKSTAYLAALFYSVNRVNNFYVYGAGSHLRIYEQYMEMLKVNNIRLVAETFSSLALESNRSRTVVGLLANPPNSFSAVSDPIDLICSRGGDLTMLEILTESTISEDGKQRVALILKEQLNTLQAAMSRPQTQFLLYQTHSVVKTENEDMVQYAMKMVNQRALEKHKTIFIEKRRQEVLDEFEAGNTPLAALKPNSPRKRNAEGTGIVRKESILTDMLAKIELEAEETVKLPQIDEFIFMDIPDICKNRDNCLNSSLTGCFLSLLTRKDITRLNAKYLIRMAEKRGLFGKAENGKGVKAKAAKSQDSTTEKPTAKTIYIEKVAKSSYNVENVMIRLGKATNASQIRSNLAHVSKYNHPILFNYKNRSCTRYVRNAFKISENTLWKRRWQHRLNLQIRPRWNRSRQSNMKLKKIHSIGSCRVPYPIHIKNICI